MRLSCLFVGIKKIVCLVKYILKIMPVCVTKICVQTSLLVAWSEADESHFKCVSESHEYQALRGHVLPVASVDDFVVTPGGLRHGPTKSTPDHVCMLVAAKEKPTPENYEGVIRVKHDVVVSLCDDGATTFAMEAMCTLADMFAYNMGDEKPRYAVGSLRLNADKSKIFTVSRLFPLEMELSVAKELHLAEVDLSLRMQVRQGQKQKANTLMQETPAKRPYKPNQ